MNVFKMRDTLKSRLTHLEVQYQFNRDQESLRIYRTDNQKGVTVKLSPIVAKYNKGQKNIIDEIVYYVEETIHQMQDEAHKILNEKRIMPVIRATSFPTQTKEGNDFVTENHTAETRIYYALDLGKSYRLIDESLLKDLNLTEQQIKEMALFNVRKLDNPYKTDEVKGNIFYFINTNDGYDASRVLNASLLSSFEDKIEGEMLIALPHQDVLIIADIRNKTGYDIMAHMTMEFFTNGLVPITSLSLGFEKGRFEPIFILGKNNKSKLNASPNVVQHLGASKDNKNKE
ncbi:MULTISPECIES: DUF1444 domain-containing protein [Staphylococcus]|uniref:UPF0354 protein RCF65_03985 n=2 Tax=Staphylococcus chromogenes TaxID=46126 RepID=A0ABD5AUM1_STACR|nr:MULTISPECIES: DUF1444 domain-containing protein [Staphylococcus]MCE5091423.1 DUF1444 domain-containing protein [Staphylococcus chromogenes]MDQ7175141.1 DUF1444 domain-containing protein [Staphylococcus chromogenes]MDT0670736.1 DUF1444 domain-containing protein [Staphylococcus chromogenes]MDT0672928.1 DUF1444 domain-containing protein [Staphylococcus chromogenes]MDT0692616.1 DUF1444 domain-containing protein [Staphylococcus chromogenes]